jgi:hypothetical protein
MLVELARESVDLPGQLGIRLELLLLLQEVVIGFRLLECRLAVLAGSRGSPAGAAGGRGGAQAGAAPDRKQARGGRRSRAGAGRLARRARRPAGRRTPDRRTRGSACVVRPGPRRPGGRGARRRSGARSVVDRSRRDRRSPTRFGTRVPRQRSTTAAGRSSRSRRAPIPKSPPAHGSPTGERTATLGRRRPGAQLAQPSQTTACRHRRTCLPGDGPEPTGWTRIASPVRS